ncbi:hypothetical protein [Staphylococcus simulans]|uniref:hypothetical protein n=1 Tax=Staphylococcus simulans TaxID=1286 RepID=UPI0021D3821B|nr:hypothetical protein [Staphylococcus simulans]UXV43112.1 hypothetical protein MUA12_03965 [Staphylococcus simulans]
MEYKLNLPESCPPSKANSADLDPVYRLISGDTLDKNDLISHVEAGLNFPKKKECEAHAISFHKDIEGCKKLKQRHKKFRNKKIYRGRLTKECGVTDNYLDNSHINLWVYKNIDLLSVFQGGEAHGYEI